MTLLNQYSSPLEDTWVSLDLETTGLSPDTDEIIEVAAVKFQGSRTIDTFHSLANPSAKLSTFIQRFTGIAQAEIDRAPPFSQVARDLAPFIGSAPVVGHNIAFDLGFLDRKGLRLSNPRCDTWDLAYVLMPDSREYSLAKLADTLGISHPRPHRAVDDALAARGIFLKLADMAAELDVFTLADMEQLASRSSWVLSYFLRGLASYKIIDHARTGDTPSRQSTSATGIDIRDLRERFRHAPVLRPNEKIKKIDIDLVTSLLKEGGRLDVSMPGFEEREEQIAMARAVADAINEGKRLIVEAGTGVGKSLAYLLPAALAAMTNNRRVVVSTNTINLQEQLLTKDVPAAVEALAEVDGFAGDEFNFAVLKGRANYLCLRRWSTLRSSESLSDDEARLLAKVQVWLRSTAAGDRSELNLGRRTAAMPWDRLSAQGARECAGVNGVCFLRAARDRAAAAHLVIVNHALLMSDLTAGRALIPDYDVLIVDEAQHLEEEATRHLGFELGQRSFDDHLQLLGGDRGLLSTVSASLRASSAADTRRTTVDEVAARITSLLPAVRESLAGMFALLGQLIDQIVDENPSAEQQTRITSATRSQPAWSELEVQRETVDVSLAQLRKELDALISALEGLDQAGVADYEGLMIETAEILQRNTELRQRLAEFVPQPQPDGIYWVDRSSHTGDLILYSAPIHVGEKLEELLFEQKESVVLTGATLSTEGTFEHIRGRTGFNDADELLLGSPFDYQRAALLCVPEDMPEPTSWEYRSAMQQAIADATVAAGGRTMALFTSHASLRETAGAIREGLQAEEIDVLAQGIDGPPHQLVRTFLDNPRSVLLGTASFWEGVDLAGEALKVLLVARLPFSVPTEPVFMSRSELYDEPFDEYAVPQAILRLRQGFGRLIRTKTDRGVVVILDRRIISRRYGKAFLDSLPDVTLKTSKRSDLTDEVRGWLAR